MTHILHRQIGGTLPVAAGGTGPRDRRHRGPSLHRCVRWRRRLVPGPRPSRGDGRPARTARPARLCPYGLLHHRGRRTSRRPVDRRRAAGPVACLSGERRIGGHRGLDQDGAAILHRARGAETAPHHRPTAELPRQHAGCAGRRRQRMAARALRTAPGRDAPYRSVLRLPLPGARRIGRGIRPSRCRCAGTEDPRAWGRERPGVRRRDGGRRHCRRGAAGARLLQAHPGDLRSLRRAADPRRGHVRHGPYRHASCLRAGGHRARSHDHRQGAGRRLRADWCGAARPPHLRRFRRRQRLLPARPHLYGAPHGLRGGACGAGDHPARQSSRQREEHGRAAAAPARRAFRQPPACR